MILTDTEKQQIERIIRKTKQIKALDPNCEVFGSKAWEYEWPETADEEELTEFERIHKITLPREYRLFLRHIANGGPGFAYGLYPLDETQIFANIKKPCMIMEQPLKGLSKTVPVRAYNGLLIIATEGCCYYICIVVTGDLRGRIILTDFDGGMDSFRYVQDKNFLDWYERWLDNFISGMDMNSFGASILGNQQELCKRFSDETNVIVKETIINSLGRFPDQNAETTMLWENVCKIDSSAELRQEALKQLISKHIPSAPNIMKLFLESFDENRDICIELLRFANDNGVDNEPFLAELLGNMPTSAQLFANVIYAAMKTSLNKYEVFLPFLTRTDIKKNSTKVISVMNALREAPDRVDKVFVGHIIPFFQCRTKTVVNHAILVLSRIKDERVPPLVDEACQRYRDFSVLCKNYYKNTWEK